MECANVGEKKDVFVCFKEKKKRRYACGTVIFETCRFSGAFTYMRASVRLLLLVLNHSWGCIDALRASIDSNDHVPYTQSP